MSLTPHMFDLISFVPPTAFIPIAQINLATLSNLALRRGFGGIAGHYFLLNQKILNKHHHRGQVVGTGYPKSQNCLFREINRGVDWIFSNNAAELQTILNKLFEPNSSKNHNRGQQRWKKVRYMSNSGPGYSLQKLNWIKTNFAQSVPIALISTFT